MTHHDLPLPDFDDLPLGSIESRVRTLDESGVQRLLDYERTHADRAAVVQILERRAEALAKGAAPSGGSPDARQPETHTGAEGGSDVSPATTGPVQNPPSQGVPTNPAQPRR